VSNSSSKEKMRRHSSAHPLALQVALRELPETPLDLFHKCDCADSISKIPVHFQLGISLLQRLPTHRQSRYFLTFRLLVLDAVYLFLTFCLFLVDDVARVQAMLTMSAHRRLVTDSPTLHCSLCLNDLGNQTTKMKTLHGPCTIYTRN